MEISKFESIFVDPKYLRIYLDSIQLLGGPSYDERTNTIHMCACVEQVVLKKVLFLN